MMTYNTKTFFCFIIAFVCFGFFAIRLAYGGEQHRTTSDVFTQTIERVDVVGVDNISEGDVLDAINIETGDPFSSTAIENAVYNLKQWGVFETINVKYEPSAQGYIVIFNLKEAKVVASIDITGNYPYLENKVRKYLSLHPGEIYSPDSLPEQVTRIKEFYAREGFTGTQVFADEEDYPDWGGTVLTFHIKRGQSIRVRNITVQGNKHVPIGRFVSIINPYRQFSERRLSDSLKRIKTYYHARGFPKARIRVKEKKIDPLTNRVDISLEVYEGPHVDVFYKGAPHVSRKTLNSAVTIFKEGSFDSYEIDKSKEAISQIFIDHGFPDVKINTEKSEISPDKFALTFFIDEGRPQRIKHLRFEGNENVSSSFLRKGLQNQKQSFSNFGAYYPGAVTDDDEMIVKKMQKNGFLDAKIGTWDVKPTNEGYSLNVTVPVGEGLRTIVGEVSFIGNNSFTFSELLRATKNRPGKPFDLPGLDEDKQLLELFYADNGRPYAKVEQSWKINPSNNNAVITYNISEGAKVTIGEILIVGDVMSSQKAIRKAMDIRSGDPYSSRKILNSQLNIRRLGAFANVNIEPIGLKKMESKIPLKVRVEEQRPFQVDLGLGYSTFEQLTGSLIFTNLNAFGWAKSNTLKLIGGRKYSRLDLGWLDPRFLSTGIEMAVNAWIQYTNQPSYTSNQIGSAVGWLKKFRRLGFSFRYEIDRNYYLNGDYFSASGQPINNNTISKISMSGSFDSRDSFSNPKKGFFTLGSVQILNDLMGSDANFAKFSWQGENDLSFLRNYTITTDLRFDYIQSIGDNVIIPINEALFLGGDDTIRGYARYSLGPRNANDQITGGTTRWIWNEEFRIGLFRDFAWAFFYDMGSLTNGFSSINSGTIRKSTGFGIRYITPVGPFRLDYAFKIGKRPGESRSGLHFTFGFVF